MDHQNKTRAELAKELTRMRQHVIASEERYRVLVDNTQIPITYLTLDGYVLLINKIGAHNLGGTPESFISKCLREILPDLADITDERIKHVLKKGQGDQFEDRINLPEGDRWFVSHFYPVKDTSGDIFAIQIVSHDCTEKKEIEDELDRYRENLEVMVLERTELLQDQIEERERVEQALRESEERSTSILENSPDYIVEFDRDFTILFANQPAPGHTIKEAIGSNVLDYISPRDHDRFKSAAFNTFNAGLFEIIETEVIFPDKQTYTLETRFGPITRDGKIVTLVMIARDITDRKRKEEALRASEEKLRAMFEAIQDGISLTDLEGNTIDLNEAAVRMGGYSSKEELIGVNGFQFISESDRDRVNLQVEELLKNGFSKPCEYRFIRRNGEEFDVEASASLIYDSAGTPIGSINLVRDITERKQAEMAVKESEEKYRSLVENINDVIFSLDTQGYFTYASPVIESIWGYRVEDVLFKHFTEFVMPGDLPGLVTSYEQTLRGQYEPHEFRIVDCNNRIRFVRTSSRKMVKGGDIVGITGIVTDITAQKLAEMALIESEEKYKTLTNNLAVGVYRNTPGDEGKFLEINPFHYKMFGYDSKEEFLEINVSDLYVDPEDRTELSRKLQTRGSINNELVILKKKDGTPIICSVTAVAVKGDEGDILYFDGIIEDITDRQIAQQALIDSEERFRSIFENVTDTIVYVDMTGTIIDVNSRLMDLCGHDPEEMIGKRFSETGLLSEESLPDVERTLNETVTKGVPPQSIEIVIHHRNGGNIIADTRPSLLTLSQGTQGILVVIRDITKRKEAEDALEESVRLYRLLAENVTDVIWTMDMHLRYTYISPSITEMQGYTVKEALTRRPEENLAPDSYRIVTEILAEEIERENEPGVDLSRTRTVEVETRHRDGHTIWVEITMRFLRDEAKRPIGIIGVTRDISERKQTEKQLLQRNLELTTLNAIAQTLTSSLNLNDVLNNTLDKIIELFSIKQCFVLLLEDESHANLRVYRGIPNKYVHLLQGFDLTDSLLGQVVRTGEPRFVASLEDVRDNIKKHIVKVIEGVPLGSAMFVPLKAKGEILGVLTVISGPERELTRVEQDLLITIGLQISTVVENSLLYEKIHHEGQVRREGLRQSILMQEEERRRIARELHDQTSQVLTGASAMIEASVASLPWGFDQVKSNLKQVRASLTSMLVDVRNIIYELRPTMLDDLGLVAAARWQAEEYLGRAGIKARFETKGRAKKLEPQMETALFRIIQEATTNIVKHAKATRATVRVEFTRESIFLEIEDNGKGISYPEGQFDKGPMKGFGFVSMRERAEILGGTFSVESQTRQGTRILVEVPL